MPIRKLQLHQVGPFEDATFEFPGRPQDDQAELHILTGPNGCGKSTVLYALASLFSNEDRTLLNNRRFGISSGTQNYIKPWENGDDDLVVMLFWLDKDKDWIVRRRSKEWKTDAFPPDTSGKLFRWSDGRVFAYSGNRYLRGHQLESIKEVKSDPMDGALDFNSVPDSGDLIQWIATSKAKAALETVNNNQYAAARYTNALSKLEKALSTVIDGEVRFDLQTNPLHLRLVLDGQKLELDVLPDGLKSIIGWLGDLIMRLDRLEWDNDLDILSQEFVLLLDEIDIHLHPSWQRSVLPMVQTLFPNAQIFCSTHSPFVVNSVDNAWIHAIELEGNKASPKEPVLSQEGRSYASVLSEIFGVKQRFGPDLEKRIKDFYDLRSQVLEGNTQALEAFKQKGEALASVSQEVSNIITPELRQIERALERAQK